MGVSVFDSLDKAKPLFNKVYDFLLIVCKLLLIGTIAVTCLMVGGRYWPWGRAPAWTEEVILTLMAYMSLLSAALAVRKRAHIRMVALDPFLNKTFLKWLDLIADVLVIAFCILLMTEGYRFAVNIGARGFFTSMPNIPLTWRFLPVPLGAVFMLFFSIEVFYDHIRAMFIKDDKPESAEAIESAYEVKDGNV